MKRCYELAELGKGSVSPNPMVGAMLVYNDRIIGEGWHKAYGGPHAEVNCINSVKEEDEQLIRESTMYVSLEPCAHYGKTPPCAELLVKEQVKRVVIGNMDPHEAVAGKGVKLLEDNNVAVTAEMLPGVGRWINRRFLCFHEQQRPYIILKWANSQDGYMAPINRQRLQISNKHSQQLVHKWRTEEDAILVGYTTVVNDNPSLTSRLWQGKSPLRIVIDEKLQLDNSLNVFDGSVETWIVNAQKDEQADKTQYIKLDFGQDIIRPLMSKLHTAKVLSIIIEGGAYTLSRFIESGLWDEARVFTAGKMLHNGVKAPSLNGAKHIYATDLLSDQLDVYVKADTKYPYVKGLNL